MKYSGLADEKIIGLLRHVEGGAPVKEPCRKHGFSDTAFYRWRDRLGNLSVSETRRLRELESENAKLRKLLIGDEFVYLPFGLDEASLFFSVVARRDERGSMVLTSHRPFTQWATILTDD